MQSKCDILRKKLIINGIVASVIFLALLTSGIMLSNYSDDTAGEKQAKENENQTKQAEANTLKTKINKLGEFSEAYALYTQYHNKDLSLNRSTVTNILNRLREKHHLVNLEATISPISDTKEITDIKSSTVLKSQVKLSFGALTDNSIYNFIEAIQSEFPGIVVIDSLRFSKKSSLSREVLLNLNSHKITPMVSGELSFFWVGIKSNDSAKAEGMRTPNGATNAK